MVILAEYLLSLQSSGTPMLGIERPPQKAEWDIIQGYANRVRHLRVLNPLRPVQQSVILTLFNPPTTSPLFPNLRSLVWNDNRLQTLAVLRTLCGPLLTSLTFDISSNALWNSSAFATFTAVPHFCPAVKVITLPSSSISPSHMLSGILLAWNHLEEVTCGEIDTSTFFHLARQPSLRKLAFTLSRSVSDHCLSPQAFSRVR